MTEGCSKPVSPSIARPTKDDMTQSSHPDKIRKKLDSVRVKFYTCFIMGLTPLTREELINKPVDSFLPILPSHPKGNETVDMRLPENRMPEVIDTLITTPHVLDELSAAIQTVKTNSPGPYPYDDVRMTAWFYYRNHTVDIIDYHGTYLEDFTLNGQEGKENDRLTYLLRQHSGFYWFHNLFHLTYMHELYNISFPQDTVVNADGVRLYYGKPYQAKYYEDTFNYDFIPLPYLKIEYPGQ